MIGDQERRYVRIYQGTNVAEIQREIWMEDAEPVSCSVTTESAGEGYTGLTTIAVIFQPGRI